MTVLTPTFRPARFEDVPAILDLIVKGAPGAEVRIENAPEAAYRAAFDAIERDDNQMLFVGYLAERGVVSTMQLILPYESQLSDLVSAIRFWLSVSEKIDLYRLESRDNS